MLRTHVKFIRIVQSNHPNDQSAVDALLDLEIDRRMTTPDAVRAEFSMVDVAFGARPLVDDVEYEDVLAELAGRKDAYFKRLPFTEAVQQRRGVFELTPLTLSRDGLREQIYLPYTTGKESIIPLRELENAASALNRTITALLNDSLKFNDVPRPAGKVLSGPELACAVLDWGLDPSFFDIMFDNKNPETHRLHYKIKAGALAL